MLDIVYADMYGDRPLEDWEAQWILTRVEQRHDCNYGVTWETLNYFIEEHLREGHE